ncbi:isatin hydrolase-like [Oratosquilla oratoria]|uniref:isatin hydrolase-like n=1 Tax=Oratosquilla oratoria TaxID=337810 RepID=UPI003F76ED53
MLWLVTCLCFCVSAQGALKYVDLTFAFGEDTMQLPSYSAFEHQKTSRGYMSGGYWFESNDICLSEHSGTHLDAPAHYAEGKWTVDQIPLERLVGPAVVMDISDKVSQNATAELSADDVTTWLETHGPIPDGAIVLVKTGWAKFYGNITAYIGPDARNPVFPGISPSAANVLVDYERMTGHQVVGVGLDAPSLDHGLALDFPTHQELAQANIYGLENVGNLELLPTTGAMLTVLPMKIRGGSGGPTRILATLPDTSGSSLSQQSVESLLMAHGLLFLMLRLLSDSC